jgi:hypothetical protein
VRSPTAVSPDFFIHWRPGYQVALDLQNHTFSGKYGEEIEALS